MICRVRSRQYSKSVHWFTFLSTRECTWYHVSKITITECKLDKFPLLRETVLKIKHTILRTLTYIYLFAYMVNNTMDIAHGINFGYLPLRRRHNNITQYCRKDVRKYCILKLMLLKSYSKIKRLQHVIRRISRGFGLDMIFIQLVHFPSPRLRNRNHTTR